MQPQANSFLYVECDIPAGLTVDEWRRRNARPRRRFDALRRKPAH